MLYVLIISDLRNTLIVLPYYTTTVLAIRQSFGGPPAYGYELPKLQATIPEQG